MDGWPKRYMTITELAAYGLDRTYLNKLTKLKTQTFCWKKNPAAAKSTYIFDMVKFDEWEDKQIALQRKMLG